MCFRPSRDGRRRSQGLRRPESRLSRCELEGRKTPEQDKQEGIRKLGKRIVTNEASVSQKNGTDVFLSIIFILLHLADLPCLSTGFFPTGVKLIHQCMETGIVTGFQQMTKLMNHHMLDAPFRQQQQIGREADGLILDIADTPTRDHRLVIDHRRGHTHLL